MSEEKSAVEAPVNPNLENFNKEMAAKAAPDLTGTAPHGSRVAVLTITDSSGKERLVDRKLDKGVVVVKVQKKSTWMAQAAKTNRKKKVDRKAEEEEVGEQEIEGPKVRNRGSENRNRVSEDRSRDSKGRDAERGGGESG